MFSHMDDSELKKKVINKALSEMLTRLAVNCLDMTSLKVSQAKIRSAQSSPLAFLTSLNVGKRGRL